MKRRRKKRDLEICFFEGLVKERPNFVDALLCLGDAYTRQGFYEEGLAVDKKLTELTPNDPIVNYNTACSYSLVNQFEQALKYLKRAIDFGYTDFDYILKDDDLKLLRDSPEFNVFWTSLKEKEPAFFKKNL